MSIRVDMKWFRQREFGHDDKAFNLLDAIAKGILLEGTNLEYHSNIQRLLNKTNNNWDICTYFANYMVSPYDVSNIDEIVEYRRKTTKEIFNRIKTHPDIVRWLNGEAPLNIEFYNCYRIAYSYEISEGRPLDENQLITISQYIDSEWQSPGMIVSEDARSISIAPPNAAGHEFYNMHIFDVYKAYSKCIDSRYVYNDSLNVVTPGYILINSGLSNCCCGYGRYGLFSPNNRANVRPNDNITIGNLIAWVLYNSDKFVIMNIAAEKDKGSVKRYLNEHDPNIFSNDGIADYFNKRFGFYYEDPYGYGMSIADGLRFRQSIPNGTIPYINLANDNFIVQSLDYFLKFMMSNSIRFTRTPLKEQINIDIICSAFKRKHFKTRKVKGEENFDSYAEVLKALATGFMGALKTCIRADELYKANKGNPTELLKFVVEEMNRFSQNSDEENIKDPSGYSRNNTYIRLH